MPMSNREIEREVKNFQRSRQAWIDILVKCPGHSEAPVMILSINSKIELLLAHVNWSEDISL